MYGRCYVCAALAFLRHKLHGADEKREYEAAVKEHDYMHERSVIFADSANRMIYFRWSVIPIVY